MMRKIILLCDIAMFFETIKSNCSSKGNASGGPKKIASDDTTPADDDRLKEFVGLNHWTNEDEIL